MSFYEYSCYSYIKSFRKSISRIIQRRRPTRREKSVREIPGYEDSKILISKQQGTNGFKSFFEGLGNYDKVRCLRAPLRLPNDSNWGPPRGGGSLADKCATHPCSNTSEMDPKWRITAHQICTPKWRHTCKT